MSLLFKFFLALKAGLDENILTFKLAIYLRENNIQDKFIVYDM